MQCTEGVGGRVWLGLSRVAVEEVEGVIEALFLAGLHGAGGDVPNALPALQTRESTPVEVQRYVQLIRCPLPRLVHFRSGKQRESLRGDETMLPCFDLAAFTA